MCSSESTRDKMSVLEITAAMAQMMAVIGFVFFTVIFKLM